MSATSGVLTQVPLIRALAAAGSGALIGLGVWVAVAAVRGWLPQRTSMPGRWSAVLLPTPTHRRIVLAGLVAAVIVATAVRMPVVGVLVLGAVWVGLDLVGGPSLTRMNEVGAGIAAWAETVRQELEAGQPQRAALIAACEVPPPGLEEPLQRLADRLDVMGIPPALWGFAHDVRHPATGHVVAALDVAYRYGAADLPRLMAGQVDSTRHQVQMAREIHAARAKHRRAMLLLLGLFALVVTGLFIAWPDFLDAYRDGQGQVVLGAIGVSVLIAVRSLVRLSQITPPPDFFTGTAPDGEPDQETPAPGPFTRAGTGLHRGGGS